MTLHKINRIRHETRRRTLTIDAIEHLTPRMRRIRFRSPELHDFVSASADDHIKLFFPSEESGDGRPVMRDFTPRQYDLEAGTLVIDFALHDAGPATQWAESAAVGDTLEIGGPRGSAVIPDDFDWYILIGDETALPAMGRRVEELRPGVPVITIGLIDSSSETQGWATEAAWMPLWLVRDGVRDDAELVKAHVNAELLPQGDGFVWIAAETNVARALRTHMLDTLHHPREWIKAAGYWTRGEADAHERIEV